jgi:hypothetical protein
MKISVKGFISHKLAEKYVDCFDRYGINISTNKFAISDGVSKSFFPDLWAELLVDYFLRNDGGINFGDADSYKAIQDEWLRQVGEIVNKPNQKYYVRNFFSQGRSAAATFVGLHFHKHENDFKWDAFALGDSFLFFLPANTNEIDGELSSITFLSSKSDFLFNNFPDFFDSRNINPKGKIKHKGGKLVPGTFYLMTDALSEWFIAERMVATKEITSWKSQADFEQSLERLRKDSLQNDDSTILVIDVVDDSADEFVYDSILFTSYNELLAAEASENDSNRIADNVSVSAETKLSDAIVPTSEDEKLEDRTDTSFAIKSDEKEIADNIKGDVSEKCEPIETKLSEPQNNQMPDEANIDSIGLNNEPQIEKGPIAIKSHNKFFNDPDTKVEVHLKDAVTVANKPNRSLIWELAYFGFSLLFTPKKTDLSNDKEISIPPNSNAPPIADDISSNENFKSNDNKSRAEQKPDDGVDEILNKF